MNLLPIVERELRVAARRPATHWTRFFAALATLTIWFLIALSTPQRVPVPQLSKTLFTCWFILGFGFDLVFGVRAQSRLQRRFREIAPGPLSKQVKAQPAESAAPLRVGQRAMNSAQP